MARKWVRPTVIVSVILLILVLTNTVGSRKGRKVPTVSRDAVEDAVTSVLDEQLQQNEAEFAEILRNEQASAYLALLATARQWETVNTEQLICIRATAYADKLRDWANKTGKDIELVYRDEFAAHINRIQQWQLANNSAVMGDAARIADARAIAQDTLALALLGINYYEGKESPLCDNAIDAEVQQLVLTYGEIASRVDEKLAERQRLDREGIQAAQTYWKQQTEGVPEGEMAENRLGNKLKQMLSGIAAND